MHHVKKCLVPTITVVATLTVVFLAMGMQSTASSTAPVAPTPFTGVVVRVEGIPAPSQMMRVTEGSPFLVPDGMLFVATGVGRRSFGGFLCGGPAQCIDHTNYFIRFNGEDVFWRMGQWALIPDLSNPANSGGEAELFIPPGLVAPAGTTVSVEASFNVSSDPVDGVLLGYLADA